MTTRSNFVKDIFLNGKQDTWENYAIKYGFRDGKQANDYYRWFIKNGSIDGEWEPGIEISEIEAPEILQDPVFDIVNSREYQEFLAWKAEQESKRTFIPGDYLILGCTHVPFHNKKFFEAVLRLNKDVKPNGLIIAGDFLDMNSLSAHDVGKKPIDGVTLDWEYQEGKIELDRLLDSSDFTIKHYIFGNHEDRYFRHMSKVDNAKYGSALVSPKKALELDEKGFITHENWKTGVVYLGKHLEIIHGENCSIHAAKKHMDVLRTSVIHFHIHRVQMYMEGNTAAWSLGWGGDITSPAFSYASKAMKASWKNAAGVVHIDEQGGYHVTPIIWHNDRFYYGDKSYK